MFKYFFIFLCIFTSCSIDVPNQNKNISNEPDFLVFEVSHGFDVFYDSGATRSIRDYYTTGAVILNGSYFGVTDSGVYYPAGYWESDKRVVVVPGIWKQLNPIYDDPNITHFVGLSLSELKIFENNTFKENAGPYDIAFQAGPLVLSGNIIQDFGKSWHANEKHERTLIGKTKSGKIYFFISLVPITLTELGNRVIQDDRFASDPVTLLNLDGGLSSAFYDGEYGFRSDKKLPIVIKIHS